MKEINIFEMYRHHKTGNIAWHIINVDMKNRTIELEAVGYMLFFKSTINHFHDSFKLFKD